MHQALSLRAVRRSAGYTQDELAKLLEVAPSTLRRWEAGETAPGPYHLAKVCQLLRTSPERLGFTSFIYDVNERSKRAYMLSKGSDQAKLNQAKAESPSTYFVADRTNEEERARLDLQDRLTTSLMGGVLSEQKDLNMKSLLDVACGTGFWLIQTAKLHSQIEKLVGVDISGKMVDYARKQADEQGVNDRVQFRVMDALRMLEFPGGSFDFVNQRFGMSFLRTWDWPKILQEYRRVLCTNGVLRITEADSNPNNFSNSPALMRMNALFSAAFYQAGHAFSVNGVADRLEQLLQQHGFMNIQSCEYTTELRAGSEQCQLFIEDVVKLYKNARPFIGKWVKLPENFDQLYLQLVQELHDPTFSARIRLLTVWGTVVP